MFARTQTDSSLFGATRAMWTTVKWHRKWNFPVRFFVDVLVTRMGWVGIMMMAVCWKSPSHRILVRIRTAHFIFHISQWMCQSSRKHHVKSDTIAPCTLWFHVEKLFVILYALRSNWISGRHSWALFSLPSLWYTRVIDGSQSFGWAHFVHGKAFARFRSGIWLNLDWCCSAYGRMRRLSSMCVFVCASIASIRTYKKMYTRATSLTRSMHVTFSAYFMSVPSVWCAVHTSSCVPCSNPRPTKLPMRSAQEVPKCSTLFTYFRFIVILSSVWYRFFSIHARTLPCTFFPYLILCM